MWHRVGDLSVSRVVRWTVIIPVLALLLVGEWVFFHFFYDDDLKIRACLSNPERCQASEVLAYYKKHRRDPSFYERTPWTAYQLALLMNQVHLRHKTLKILNTLVKTHPRNVRLLFEIAAFYYQLNELDRSQALFLAFLPHVDGDLQWDPTTLQAMRREEAVVQSAWCVGGRPDPYKIHHYLGLIAYDKKQYQDAAFHLERTLLSEPDDVGLLRLTAFVWRQLKQFDRAAELLRHAVELREDSDQVKMELVHVLMRADRYTEAELLLREVLKRTEDHEPAFQALLSVLLVKGRYGEAIHFMEPWVKKHPERWELKHRLARLYTWAGRHQDSIRLYEELLER